MNKVLALIVSALLLACWPAYADPSARVLILNSYHAGYKGSDDLVRGIQAGLAQTAGLNAETKIEYLDSKHFSGAWHDKQVVETLAAKYGSHDYQLLVASDDYAFNVLEKNRDAIFGKVPVVFAGTNYFDESRLAGRPDYVGVDESPSFDDTLQLIFTLHPKVRRVVAIHDDTLTGRLNSQAFYRAAQKYAGRAEFSSLTGMPLEDMQAAVGQWGADTAALFFVSTLKDRQGNNIASGDVLKALVAASKVPIYGGWSFNLGDGIVGGRLIDLYAHGLLAGQMAGRILRGEDMRSLAGLQPSPNPYMFDYAQLSRFKMDENQLPAGSEIIRRPPGFFEQHYQLINTTLVVVLTAVVALAFARLKASHSAIAKSERKFMSIYKTSPDVIAFTERSTGRFIEVNEAFERVMGYTRAESIGRTSMELHTWSSQEARQQMLEALARQGGLSNYETTFKRKNGEVFPALLSISEAVVEGVPCLVFSARDITDRYQAEQRLVANEKRLKMALRIARQGWFESNLKTGEVVVSDEYPMMLGYDATDFNTSVTNWLDNVHPDDVEALKESLQSAFRNDGVQELQYRRRSKQGEWLWIFSAGQVTERDADGQPVRLTGIHMDITDRKMAEEALRANRERLNFLLSSSPAIIYTCSTAAPLDATFISDNVQELLGYSVSQFVAQPGFWADHIHPQDRARVLQGAATLRVQGQCQHDYRFQMPDGSYRWLHDRQKLVLSADNEPLEIIGYLADVSELKAAEEQLAAHRHHLEQLVAERTADLMAAKEAAEAANLAKSAFIANMSHEIRTPLNAIAGMTHILRREGVSPQQGSKLDKIKSAGDHLLDIINAVLDLSKIEAGKFVLVEEPLSVLGVVDNVSSMIWSQVKAKKLAYATDVGPVPEQLLGDRTRLQQALINYLTNAVKFTESGSISLRVRVDEEDSQHCLLRFEVMDTGPGIVPEALPRLFSAFEQADNSITRKYGGTGLGLAITRRIVQLMGGDAGVETVVGQGSTFWMTVRLKKSDAASRALVVPDESDAAATLARDYAGAKILLAEDDAFNQEIALFLLQDVGLAVDVAEDGMEAVQLARDHDYALILMDMQMPNMDGLEATRQIRQLPRHRATPCLAMTANAFTEDRQRCFDAGMHDFIPKPVDPEHLFSTLLHWLRRGSAGGNPVDGGAIPH